MHSSFRMSFCLHRIPGSLKMCAYLPCFMLKKINYLLLFIWERNQSIPLLQVVRFPVKMSYDIYLYGDQHEVNVIKTPKRHQR